MISIYKAYFMNLEKIKNKITAVFWALVFVVIILLYVSVNVLIKSCAIGFALLCSGKLKQYGINVWEGFDNSASADTGGDPDDTISSRLGKARAKGSLVLSVIANKVDLVARELFGDLNHCDKSIERDEGRKQVTTH
jgi:hypothetical protein